MHKSYLRAISKADVQREYADAAKSGNDYQRAKWGSHASMLNRFMLGARVVDWDCVESWLDIGCGTGLFFETIEKLGRTYDCMVGVDITPELIEHALVRNLNSNARFVVADLENLPKNLQENFDLVTMVGVLQQCGNEPVSILRAVLATLRPGGQLFLTTKNLGWKMFAQEGFEPEKSHSWFVYEELIEMLRELGAEIVSSGGFLPHENEIVALENSHTMYVLAKR